ncbi:Eco57I restriction-modification methylase domain-containing protein [Acidisoma sp. L85]|uniref:Eco57I restriction-modification methylase domain-containing protein n=1 Tax=Acidisoma sp. L85 TaxID=1641850 RepID=UPI00131B773B|nr:restriction endonuclease [Acidisoma sp. L85]
MIDSVFQGSLFSSDFLTESICRLADWSSFDTTGLLALQSNLRDIYARFPTTKTPNESQTEDDLIWPILVQMGWTVSLRQQNLAAKGRDDVPDGLLFADDGQKRRANSFGEEWKRYGFGLAVVESKRWARPLDRRSGRRGEETAPSTQMLRYLRRVEDLTTGKLRWGMLTNGSRWRLYYQGARSVSEQFFEIDLAAVLNIPGHNEGLFALSEVDRMHWLRVFALIFRREAFLPAPSDSRTFHQRALEEGRFYEERVANNLSNLVFQQVFPELAQAVATAVPAAPLQQVREAALILLYRLLFILYAEDRDLLPVRDSRYDDYGLRERVRGDVGKRKDRNDSFSTTAARYWTAIDDLCRAIDDGDASIGLPPYNGGLFNRIRTPLLASIRLGDAVMANVIDALSFERTSEGRKYINYRDLSVQQLGSIYERLLEHEITSDGDAIVVRPNSFARKSSGSYYTPDDLVMLILKETVGPLAAAPMKAFHAKIDELSGGDIAEDLRLGSLRRLDPAEKLLDLKICDPAMGSGHFLVSLVDYLADQVIAAMAEAEAAVPHYLSPLSDRIDAIRNTILSNAEGRGWTIDITQLDDRHIIRRMVLKRCIYGVDKNLMAVELAKVSLWLHTFTVGAPLSFLDHHLRRGDSLFGSWVKDGIDKARLHGSPLLLHAPITRALRAASKMQIIEGLTDAEIVEAHRSADVFAEVQEMTAPLDALLALIHAFDWLNIRRNSGEARLRKAFFDGQFGDPIHIALGTARVDIRREDGKRFAVLLDKARKLKDEEGFLNWQVAFPGIWSDWESESLTGGFDALVGNPPWDRLKLQKIEWWAARKPEIARAETAALRLDLISAAEAASDPLHADYVLATERAEAASRLARTGGDYPFLSAGDTNVNSLFIERAHMLVKPSGIVGLLVPSGIASDQSSAPFFRKMTEERRLAFLIDFFNKRTDGTLFFPDVYYRFKFCVYVAGGTRRQFDAIKFGFFIRDLEELRNPDRLFAVMPEDIARINPNSRTAPIFRTQRDVTLTKALYGVRPVLIDRAVQPPVKTWPVRYVRMLDMANDSDLFLNPIALDKIGAYPIGSNIWKRGKAEYLPLYEGKMVQAFDHRASDILLAEGNLFRTGQGRDLTTDDHRDPFRVPVPRYWINSEKVEWTAPTQWCLAIKDVTSVTNARTTIAAIIPRVGAGHTLPVIFPERTNTAEAGGSVPPAYAEFAVLMLANLNSVALDYLARQKVHGNHLAWYLVEQLPFLTAADYQRHFGSQTAAEIIRAAVLELTYTSHDMAPFARDMGYVDDKGDAKLPFLWDERKRAGLRAKIDALYFHLYGVTDRDDVRYIYSSFPITEREETSRFKRYQSRDLCLAWMNALSAGDLDTEIKL